MTSEEGHIRIVARQAVCAMVGHHIEVSVDADRVLLAAPRNAAGAVVKVEMIGPDGAPHRGNVTVSAKAEAAAWGIDEIVSAARRAADRFLAKIRSAARSPDRRPREKGWGKAKIRGRRAGSLQFRRLITTFKGFRRSIRDQLLSGADASGTEACNVSTALEAWNAAA